MSRLFEPVAFVAANEPLLATLPLCNGLPFPALRAFLEACEYRQLAPDEVLLSPDIDNHHLYVGLRGRLEVHVDQLGSSHRIDVPNGELIGEVSIVDGLRPTSHVCAASTCEVLAIHEDLLWNHCLTIPGVARNVLQLMATRMRDRYVAIQRATEQAVRLEALERELSIAAELQSSILPAAPLLPAHAELRVTAHLMPAKEIGGDFYDAFDIDDRRVCIAVGDVAGKGIPAALFMMRCVTLLRTEMLRLRSAQAAISAMNAALCENNPTCLFVTLAILLVDLDARTVEYVSGGHDAPFFRIDGGGFARLERPRGMMLGVNPAARHESKSIPLQAGTTVVLYTDGVTEAMNAQDDEYTEARLQACLDADAAQDPARVVARVLEDVERHAGGAPQSDDLTLVAVRLTG